MWVFCGGMQRSGSTLQFQLTAELIEMSGKGQRQEYATPDALPKVLQGAAHDPRYKVVKTHVFTPAIEAEFKAGRAMGVYTFRDIRDVVVSIMHKENKVFDTVWVNHRIGKNLEWYDQWTSQPKMLVSKYENVMADLPAEVARLAGHFGIDVSTEECARIAGQFGIEQQRKTIEQVKSKSNLGSTANGAQFDPHTLLHTNHIYSGEIGGWKSELKPEQIAYIESFAGRWLTDNGYPLQNA